MHSINSLLRVGALALAVGLTAASATAAAAHMVIRVPAGTPQTAELMPLIVKWRQAAQISAAKVLVRYTMFLERGPVGEADSLGVLEYRDPAAFAAATQIKLDLRGKLAASHPGYAKFDPIKAGLRKDVGGTIAAYAELPPPELRTRPAAKR